MNKAIKIALLSALAWAGAAGAQNYEAVLSGVQAKYQKITSLKAHLDQQLCSAATGTCTMYRGEVEMQRPNKLRYDIVKPEKQLIICDGRDVWSRVLAGKTVIKSDLKKPSQMLIRLHPLDKMLSGRAAEGSPNDDGGYSITIESAELKEFFKTVKITVDQKSLLITGIEAEDINGNTAHYSFSKIKVNQGTKDSRFKFITPKNAEIKKEP